MESEYKFTDMVYEVFFSDVIYAKYVSLGI